MRPLLYAAAALFGVALLAYTIGLGIYAVASTKPSISTQPRSVEEARFALDHLGLGDAYPFEHKFLLTPHGRMHFADEGRGPVILCLHGNASWSLECAEVLRTKSADSRVLAPDLVGFGLSEKPRTLAPDTVAAHAQDLAVLVEILDLRDVQVIAPASSAAIGIELARIEPERVKSSVIHETRKDESSLAERLARAPVLGEIVVQGLGALSPGFARGPFGRVQASWDERASSLALARAN